ncbi:hypothetical protein MAL1_00216 [Bacteriophage DSS3_MAL1]|nr:hypothetical protein MAL1_00216 [Bacteriophage DSS3_MAL1]
MNIFETASRQKLRFATTKGNLTVEQLWDLPLTSTKGLSLNEIGMGIKHALRDTEIDSLVDTGTSPERAKMTLSLDIIKHIIAVKQDENSEARKAQALKAEREKLMEILAKKQDAALQDLTEDQIKARLAELSA